MVISTSPLKQTEVEFSDETLEQKFSNISMDYEDQYISAGYPPKICATMISKLCPEERLQIKILDVGCGKGEVGKYLKEVGFHHLRGLECSKSLIEVAAAKGCYDKIDHFIFGQKSTVIPDSLLGQFDYVSVPSLINNSDLDINVFKNIIDCLKIGGHAIFATKLDLHSVDIYDTHIKQLEAEGFWKFTSEHMFNRYDKLCN